jgi:hypothetical protein
MYYRLLAELHFTLEKSYSKMHDLCNREDLCARHTVRLPRSNKIFFEMDRVCHTREGLSRDWTSGQSTKSCSSQRIV